MSNDPEVAALASPAARAAAALGLAAGWVLIGVPSVVLASLLTLAMVAGDLAVIIDSRVDPTVVDVDAALVLAILGALGGNALATLRARRPWGWRAVLVSVGKVFFVCSLLATASLFQPWSQPVLRVAVLFAWCLQAIVGVSLAVTACGAWLAGVLWRLSRRHSAAAVMVGLGVGASGAVAGLLSLLIIAVAAQQDANAEEAWDADGGSLGRAIMHVAEDAREQARAERLAVGAGLRSPFAALFSLREAYASSDAARDGCFEALATRKAGEPDSKFDQAARYLRLRGGLAFEDARDLAMDKALSVCVGAALADAEAARAYYWVSIEHARVDLHRSRRAARTCALTPERERKLRAPDFLEGHLELWREGCLDRARCQLSEPDRSLLTLCVEFSLRELEARGVATKSDAQRKCSKIKEKIRRIYDRMCGDRGD